MQPGTGMDQCLSCVRLQCLIFEAGNSVDVKTTVLQVTVHSASYVLVVSVEEHEEFTLELHDLQGRSHAVIARQVPVACDATGCRKKFEEVLLVE